MALVCRSCSRVNPPEARYCYHDGVALAGAAGRAGPVAVGAQPFLSPFVFPSGRVCRSFDELVLACEAEWDAARGLLREGYLEKFLGGLGRADLALAARQANRAPDADIGLSDFLTHLPCTRRDPARLRVQPTEVHLGQMTRDQDRAFTLHLANSGMGVLHGSVSAVDTPWLALGDTPGSPRKLFQCRHDFEVPVRVVGRGLRAGTRPLEGKLVIETNGGTTPVSVRVQVPVRPFPEGALAGALSPRQLAERARANPREAAALFEKGAVEAWYESNGWKYPVQGPSSSGLGAVQQFFEALGLTTPPKVEVVEPNVELCGDPGDSVEYVLHVQTPERRPVYAYAASTVPWLQAGKARLDGRVARIPLRVPLVPALPGQRLTGKVQVTANGNQRFSVPVALTVRPGRRRSPEPASPAGGWWGPTPAEPVLEVIPASGPRREVVLPEVLPEVLPAYDPPGREAFRADRPIREEGRRAEREPEEEVYPADEGFAPRRGGPGKHLLGLGVLVLALLAVLVHDLLLPSAGGPDEGPALLDPTPVLRLRFHDGDKGGTVKLPEPTMSFGLEVPDPRDPGRAKRLVWDEWGRTNNTCLRVDGLDFLFGHNDLAFQGEGPVQLRGGVGRWVQMEVPLGQDPTGRQRDGARSVWRLERMQERTYNLEVTQTAEVIPGEQSGRLDTCLVRYTLENRDRVAHDVGLRFLLDTFIGDNDGVPFTIPGRPGLCSTRERFDRPQDVPDYIQALERGDLLNPGTVAHLQFRLGTRLEAPTRVLLGGYPDAPLRELGYARAFAWYTGWDVPFVNIRELVDRQRELRRRPPRPPVPDSAVVLYWDPRPLGPGEKRAVGFTYGLGAVASAEGEGKLLLSVGGRTVRGGEFTLTALRHEPLAGERLRLTLPAGDWFELLSPEDQEVPPVAPGADRPISTVTWRLKALRTGRATVVVRSSAGVAQKQSVRISPPAQGVLD